MADIWLYAGTYTHEEPHAPGAHGPGLAVFAFDAHSGSLELWQVIADVRNASYLALDAVHQRLFCTTESFAVTNAVHMFHRQTDGQLQRVATQPSSGMATCHVCLLPDGSPCAPSYADGLIDVFPVRDGQLHPSALQRAYRGSGPNAQRQEGAHAHSVTLAPNGRSVYVCDLGSDHIWLHALTAPHELSHDPVAIAAPAGSGPRHMVFHPTLPMAYVVCELSGQVLTFQWDAVTGMLRLLREDSSCPAREPAHASCAAIRVHPTGRTLVVSDRLDGALAIFTLGADGLPTFNQRISSGGREPRDFIIDASGRWLLAANQLSDTLAVFGLDAVSGLPLTAAPRLSPLNSPACVLFT